MTQFIVVPTGDVEDNQLITLENATVFNSTALTPLVNDQAYRAFALSSPSVEFTPSVRQAEGGYDVIALMGASNQRGTHGAAVAGDWDETGTVEQFALSGDTPMTIQPFDAGIWFTPQAPTVGEVGPFWKFLQWYRDNVLQPGRKILALPVAMGGRALTEGWYPDAAAPIYDGLGTPAEAELFSAFVNSYIPSALAAADAAFGAGNNRVAALFGHPSNENDAPNMGITQLDALTRSATDQIRAVVGSDVPWVICPSVPEFSYSGAHGQPPLEAIRFKQAEDVPHMAYVDAMIGGQWSEEPIHGTDIWARAVGHDCADQGFDVARDRSVPAPIADVLGTLPSLQRVAGLIRQVASYTGPALRVSDGATEQDIGFRADGVVDWAAMESFANGGALHLTKLYYQEEVAGDAERPGLVPEGSGTVPVFEQSYPFFHGNRQTLGDNMSNWLLTDSSWSADAGTCALVVSPFLPRSGNRVLFGSETGGPALLRTGDSRVKHNTDAGWMEADAEVAGIPAGLGDYYINHVYMTDRQNLWVDGEAQATAASGGATHVSAGSVTVCGRAGQTNRYALTALTLVAVFTTTPTGADLDTLNTWAATMAKRSG